MQILLNQRMIEKLILDGAKSKFSCEIKNVRQIAVFPTSHNTFQIRNPSCLAKNRG